MKRLKLLKYVQTFGKFNKGRKFAHERKRTVENVCKITAAQIDTTPDLIKENDKSLIENLWKLEDVGIHAEQYSFIKKFQNSTDYKDTRHTVKLP